MHKKGAQNNGAAMEELEEGNPSPSMLTDSIVSNLKTEFEKRGILKFTPELEGKLIKCLNETFEGIELFPSSLTEEKEAGVTTGGLRNSQDQSDGLSTGTIDSGDGNGKKRSRYGRVIRPTDLFVNRPFKKIKLESDCVEPVVKIEQDSIDDFWEAGNGQQANFEEHEVEVEEGVVKIEVEEEEDYMTD